MITDELRRAITWWRYSDWRDYFDDDVRDVIVEILDVMDPERPYHTADQIINLINKAIEKKDRAMHLVIRPEDPNWNMTIPDGDISVEDFVFGESNVA